MWSVRDIKKKGKSALKKNYWRSVVTAALMFLLATVTSALTRIRRESILQNVGFEPLHEMAPNELLIIAGIVVVGYMSIIVSAVLIKIIFANALEAGGCLFFRNNAEKGSAELVLIREGFSDYAHVFAALLLRDVFNCLWYFSRKMMEGNKWRTFLLDMTFLGWTILGIVTFGIVNVLWTLPYYENTMAALFLELNGGQGNDDQSLGDLVHLLQAGTAGAGKTQ